MAILSINIGTDPMFEHHNYLIHSVAYATVVQVAMLSVYAATFAGFIVLLVQFINIMTKVISHRLFALKVAWMICQLEM